MWTKEERLELRQDNENESLGDMLYRLKELEKELSGYLAMEEYLRSKEIKIKQIDDAIDTIEDYKNGKIGIEDLGGSIRDIRRLEKICSRLFELWSIRNKREEVVAEIDRLRAELKIQ